MFRVGTTACSLKKIHRMPLFKLLKIKLETHGFSTKISRVWKSASNHADFVNRGFGKQCKSAPLLLKNTSVLDHIYLHVRHCEPNTSPV